MDDVDNKILETLRQNSRTPNNEIADKLGLTEGTIRNRIKRLIETGVIKKFTIETQPVQTEAIVLIRTQTGRSKETLRKIRRHVDRLFETAGEYDIAAYLTADEIATINGIVDKLRTVEGITSTVTLLKIADDKTT
ncbi:MAG TPA: winged helix-turn-helix transcriptional regulator [Candidatus Saccharimonadales bacterium]|jgi:Lrp/AsnC family transcriptional regulator, involved in the regulation of lysine biosynthesis|nr:winged helix-turn-helix transcriptional regulator [Candidatus Saccharimonadales bacterium]